MTDTELAELYRLKNVIRYNTRNHIKDESVAEHSFYVALIALKICDDHNVSDDIRLKCLVKALLHDMPETELNDITHDVKTRLNLQELLKVYEDAFYLKKYAQYANLMFDTSGNVVNLIVSYADILSVKQYVLNELTLGNKSPEMQNILNDTLERMAYTEAKLKEVFNE